MGSRTASAVPPASNVVRPQHLSRRGRPVRQHRRNASRPADGSASVACAPLWVGVSGITHSFAWAGALELPLVIAIIGRDLHRFQLLVELHRAAATCTGHEPGSLKIGVLAIGFIADTGEESRNVSFPDWTHLTRKIGHEHGWSRSSRAQSYDTVGPTGTLLVCAPAGDAKKMLAVSDALGGMSCIPTQISTAALETSTLQWSIKLLGMNAATVVRNALRNGSNVP